jgi:DNA-binding NarL/FixJ family response regulator
VTGGSIDVLVVEDNDDIRFLLTTVFRLAKDIDIVGEAHDADDALARWRELRPQVVVLDYRLPGPDGLHVAEQILSEDPTQPIILFSAFLDKRMVETAAALGVIECLSKDQVRQLPDLIRAAVAGD